MEANLDEATAELHAELDAENAHAKEESEKDLIDLQQSEEI